MVLNFLCPGLLRLLSIHSLFLLKIILLILQNAKAVFEDYTYYSVCMHLFNLFIIIIVKIIIKLFEYGISLLVIHGQTSKTPDSGKHSYSDEDIYKSPSSCIPYSNH